MNYFDGLEPHSIKEKPFGKLFDKITTTKVSYDSNGANPATWQCEVQDENGKVVETGNYLKCLFYKYKYGGAVTRLAIGLQDDNADQLLASQSKKLAGKAGKNEYIVDVDYAQFYNLEQDVMGESMFNQKFVFLNRKAKTLRESVITESDDILAAMNEIGDKSVESPEQAYAELVSADVLDDNTTVIVVEKPTQEGVFAALDAWVDDQFADQQIEPDMFMANRGVAHDYQPDYADVVAQPDNAVAKGLVDPITGEQLAVQCSEEVYSSYYGESD